jgi:hypothetical protein
MRTVNLSQLELINILDAIHPNAYDLMQAEIENKAIDELGERAWLDRWESGNWNLKLTLTYED